MSLAHIRDMELPIDPMEAPIGVPPPGALLPSDPNKPLSPPNPPNGSAPNDGIARAGVAPSPGPILGELKKSLVGGAPGVVWGM